jgi:hypothetical protein
MGGPGQPNRPGHQRCVAASFVENVPSGDVDAHFKSPPTGGSARQGERLPGRWHVAPRPVAQLLPCAPDKA